MVFGASTEKESKCTRTEWGTQKVYAEMKPISGETKSEKRENKSNSITEYECECGRRRHATAQQKNRVENNAQRA